MRCDTTVHITVCMRRRAEGEPESRERERAGSERAGSERARSKRAGSKRERAWSELGARARARK
jgi:hypothetical protein